MCSICCVHCKIGCLPMVMVSNAYRHQMAPLLQNFYQLNSQFKQSAQLKRQQSV